MVHGNQGRRNGLMWLVMVGLVGGLVCGCTEGLRDGSASGQDGVPTLKLSAVAPTTSGMAEDITVAVTPAEGGFDVNLRTSEELPDCTELFLALDYDPQALHAFGLPPSPEGCGTGLLGMVVEPTPGHIELGLTTVKDSTEMVRAGQVLLNFKLLTGGVGHAASAVADSGRARARNLELRHDTGTWVLSWDYTNPGDANQDGEVGINDLTPIGAHFHETVTNTWDDPLRHIDGDNNGEINAGDITPIGQNYAAEIFAYQIEMSEDGETEFHTVGQLLLGDVRINPGETICFSHTFGGEYVEGAWYRVVTLDRNLEFGVPSESISENGRRMDPINVETGKEVTVTLYADDLQNPLSQLNATRIVFPSCYEYVSNSANPGSPGGQTYDADGIWGSFCTAQGLLFPPDSFFVMTDLPDGRRALDLNCTSLDRQVPNAPVGYGDLINFKLRNTGSAPLTLEFQVVSPDGLKRTYFSDSNGEDHDFGNTIGIRVL
jgi:hypothetical protein